MKSLSLSFTALALLAAVGAPARAGDVCTDTARLQLKAAMFEVREEYNVKIGTCLNLTDAEEKAECLQEARAERVEATQLARAQFQARLELCDKLGDGGAYDPEIDPENFSSEIDNPYFPLPVGAVWTYESLTDEGLETVVVEVLDETREILGVECRSVRDVVMLDGEPVEDTIDWYAQDDDGNVWYFGEISFSFEDGYVESIEGSWLAGVDSAKPGIVMLAAPTPGVTYRQEWLLGDAEDAATVISTDDSVTIGIGTFLDCVQTEDFLPPEPDAFENKYFAPGIGFIYETKQDSDETLELISFSL